MHLINPQQIVSITITKITSYQNEVTSGESSEILNRKYKYNNAPAIHDGGTTSWSDQGQRPGGTAGALGARRRGIETKWLFDK